VHSAVIVRDYPKMCVAAAMLAFLRANWRLIILRYPSANLQLYILQLF